MTTLVPRVAEVALPALLGVVVLPVSSNSTVKGKVCEGGVILAVTLFEVRVSLDAPVVGAAQLAEIPPRPAGNGPALTHHS